MISLSRRSLLKASLGTAGLAAVFGAGYGGASALGQPAAAPLSLRPRRIAGEIVAGQTTPDLMSYAEAGPPPVLRAVRGQPFAVRLDNALDEPTTVHWHGVRLPNAMDGVPVLTQPYVYPGDGFDYSFTPPDAGTFWYHPHCNTLTQMGHGLAGMLVVEDPADPVFDAEIPLVLRDFRLGGDGRFLPMFKPRDAARAGTYGTVRTANWQREPAQDAPAGGLVRLRLVAADVTRIYTLALEGARALVMAIDGNPLPEALPLTTLTIGPGQRLDLALLMPDREGAVATLRDLRGSQPKTVASFRAIGPSLKRALGDLKPLAANPLPDFDERGATTIPFALSATAETAPKETICGDIGYSFWAINKVAWSGDTETNSGPLAEMKLGRSYVFEIANPTPNSHPLHLHGMVFRVLSSSAGPVPPLVSDTYLMAPDERIRLGLVADNPGNWVFHCHVIEHQKTGMTTYVTVT